MEEETTKRVEELVAKRVQQELERRKDEIEAEVLRRVEEAKKVGGARGQWTGYGMVVYMSISTYIAVPCPIGFSCTCIKFICTGTAWSMTVTPLGTKFGIGIVL